MGKNGVKSYSLNSNSETIYKNYFILKTNNLKTQGMLPNPSQSVVGQQGLDSAFSNSHVNSSQHNTTFIGG